MNGPPFARMSPIARRILLGLLIALTLAASLGVFVPVSSAGDVGIEEFYWWCCINDSQKVKWCCDAYHCWIDQGPINWYWCRYGDPPPCN